MTRDAQFYRFWGDYPDRDVEYVRWYPPTLGPLKGEVILDRIAHGPAEMGFYMHVPLCKDICPYCPFNKFSMSADRAARFLEAVTIEIDMVAERCRAAGVATTAGYFGGGTPTALETTDILRLVDHCLERFDMSPGAEISIEANPDTVDRSKLASLRAAGVNRISFGVQSFQAPFLGVLGRTHSAQQAADAIEMARLVGFDDIAIDLMYRLPGQSLDDWRRDLDHAIAVGVQHISTYCLFLDPGTRLYNETLADRVAEYPSEATEIAMYQLSQDRLGEAGFHQYTINDFALDGKESDHHCMNWRAPQGSYVGLGPGAFSFLGGPPESYIYCTIHSLREYLESVGQGRLPVRLGKRLSRAEEYSRYLVMGLRCLAVDKEGFRLKFGVDMDDVFADEIAQLSDWGLVENGAGKLWMTPKGKHYASNVLKTFFGAENYRKPQPIGVELMAGRGLSMASIDLGGG